MPQISSRRATLLSVLALALLPLAGCQTKNATVIDALHGDVDQPLAPGEFGLTKLDPKDYPDLRQAFADRAGLEQAIDKSLQYLASPSSKRFYPSGPNDPITHDQVQATLKDIKRMLHDPSITPDQFQQEVLTRYDVWTSKGYDRSGSVWFTSYYTPIFYGTKVPTSEFRFPIYRRPADLASDPITGQVFGQKQPDGTFKPYPTRSELESSGQLKGLELYYFRNPLEPYIIQVQGSALVITPDGQQHLVGYAGKNGRDYLGLGTQLVKDGKIDRRHLSLPAIIDYFNEHPDEISTYINRSDSFVFLKDYDGKEWPAGSLGVKVTPHRSLATDKSIFPRAALTFVAVDRTNEDGSKTPLRSFLLDQDTGGAIRAAGRADIYAGIGPAAGAEAGRQFAEGRLYYLFLKPGQYQQGPTAVPGLTPTTAPASSHSPGASPALPPAPGPMFPDTPK